MRLAGTTRARVSLQWPLGTKSRKEMGKKMVGTKLAKPFSQRTMLHKSPPPQIKASQNQCNNRHLLLWS